MISNPQSGTVIDEVAAGIYRISTPVDIPAIPGGFSFNQYLIVDDEPVLFHTGLRRTFPLVREAISKVMTVERLRHLSFSHYESDECGALNNFLAAAPQALPLFGDLGTLVSVDDAADRPGRGLADGERIRTGQRELEWIYTPHVPHGWDCGVLFDHSSGTLFCGDLFTQPGSKHPPVTEADILGPSEMMRGGMDYYAHSRNTSAIFERLANLRPSLLACMHGSAWRGDGAGLIRELEKRVEGTSLLTAAP